MKPLVHGHGKRSCQDAGSAQQLRRDERDDAKENQHTQRQCIRTFKGST